MAMMVTINKPSFWIFIGACIILYIYNHFIVPGNADIGFNVAEANYICITAFTGLFLNLISGAIKSNRVNRMATIFCYLFEVLAVLALGAMLFVKRR